MLLAQNIHKKYGDLEIVKGVDLHIAERELVSIVGASGAGKSTLLQIIGTILAPDSGSLKIAGISTKGMNDRKLSAFRNQNIGFIFQFHQLLPEFTAIENVCIPARIAGKSKKEAMAKGMDLLNRLGLSHRAEHKPSAMSGGEQQRVAVARALVNSPKLVLADEPSGNLDTKNAQDLHQLFFDLRHELGLTFVIVTHNEQLAANCDRKLTMKDGLFV